MDADIIHETKKAPDLNHSTGQKPDAIHYKNLIPRLKVELEGVQPYCHLTVLFSVEYLSN